jgi:hypothetical protein
VGDSSPRISKKGRGKEKNKRLQKYNNLEWDCVRFATSEKGEAMFVAPDWSEEACG